MGKNNGLHLIRRFRHVVARPRLGTDVAQWPVFSAAHTLRAVEKETEKTINLVPQR